MADTQNKLGPHGLGAIRVSHSNSLDLGCIDPDQLAGLVSISPRPSGPDDTEGEGQSDQTFFSEDHVFGEQQTSDTSLELPGEKDIDLIDQPTLPPIMKQFQRKPSTRAWQFREILNDMNNGLFEKPSKEQLDELWRYVDKDDNGVLDRGEIISMIEHYIELCQVVAKKQIQRHQNVMRRLAGRQNRRMSQTLGKLASKTQVVCNQWINRLHTNPDELVDRLISDLIPDQNTQWNRQDFYENAPQALKRLKEQLKMHEWAEKAAELINLDQQTMGEVDDDVDEDKPNRKKRLEGILTIKVVGALDLKPDDSDGRELCSPYCILHVGNKKLPTIFLQDTNNPEWSQKFRFTRYRFKFGQSRQGTLYVMDWSGEETGASLVGFADFKIPDTYVEDAQMIELTLRDNNEKQRGYLTITLSLQPKRPEYMTNDDDDK